MQPNNKNTLHSKELGKFVKSIEYFMKKGIKKIDQSERLEHLSYTGIMMQSFFTENIIAKLDQDGRDNLS